MRRHAIQQEEFDIFHFTTMEWIIVKVGNNNNDDDDNGTSSNSNNVYNCWRFIKPFDDTDTDDWNHTSCIEDTVATIIPKQQEHQQQQQQRHYHSQQQYYFDRRTHRIGRSIIVVPNHATVNNNSSSSSIIDHEANVATNQVVLLNASKKRKRTTTSTTGEEGNFVPIQFMEDNIPVNTDTTTTCTTTNTTTTRSCCCSNYSNNIEHVPLRHLLPIYDTTTTTTNIAQSTTVTSRTRTLVPILVTETTNTFRLLTSSQIHHLFIVTNDDDDHHNNNNNNNNNIAVLEIGTSTGMTSEVVWEQIQKQRQRQSQQQQQQQQPTGRWMGFDTGADMVQMVNDKLHKLNHQSNNNNNNNTSDNDHWAVCYHIDPLLDPDTASTLVHEHFGQTTTTYGCVVGPIIIPITVLIDIGGNREESGVLRMVDWVLQTFQYTKSTKSSNALQLHQIIIKSESIYTSLHSRYTASKSTCINNETDDNITTIGSTDYTNMGWYISRLRIALRTSLPKHPLQAPKRFVPVVSVFDVVNENDGMNETTHDNDTHTSHQNSTPRQLICRYHNYHKKGCAKKDSAIACCPHNHTYCHVCLARGHIARTCPYIFQM